MLARERGKINFENLIVVDKNEDCKVYSSSDSELVSRLRSRQVEEESRSIRLEISDWTDFLTDYIANTPKDTPDLIVPSHTAPHILGRTFLTLILRASGASREVEGSSRLRSNNKEDLEAVSMFDIQTKIGTPFEKKLEKGVIAVSMATWRCPANCTEPAICPHTHAPRHWDLENLLKNWAKANGIDNFYVFPAHHFAFAVSAIPAQTVIDAWRSLQNLLQKKGDYIIGVATASACHGIVSIIFSSNPSLQ